MLRIHSDALNQELNVHQIEMHMVVLGQLHLQMQNLELQATLIAGFALGQLSSDLLTPLGSDLSEFCIYKDEVQQASCAHSRAGAAAGMQHRV